MMPRLRWLIALLSFALPECAAPAVGLDDFWNGRAHFEQVGSLTWGASSAGQSAEGAGWFAVHGGVWYVFNRASVPNRSGDCPQDHTMVVVRESHDKGRSWSDPTTAIEPGISPSGDHCAVLDGTSFYDGPTNTWHILAQCLGRPATGGWALCHYVRKGTSPRGPFAADPLNPVVRGGELWSRICSGIGKACPVRTMDEGTPDVVTNRNGHIVVTFHGYDPLTKDGFRGVARTTDFHNWQVSGDGLPNDATLGPADCKPWLADCTGVGEAATVSASKYHYMIVERMNKGLLCTANQNWKFELIRSSNMRWPRSGSRAWEKLPGQPLIVPAHPDAATPCPVSYARWLIDGTDLYLIYEDADPGRTYVHRRLLKLIAGAGSTVKTE